jgi:hypothetical protein
MNKMKKASGCFCFGAAANARHFRRFVSRSPLKRGQGATKKIKIESDV